MICRLGEMAIRDMDAESIEARIHELLDGIRRLRPDEKFDGGVEAVALLRVMAKETILLKGDDTQTMNRWAKKWDTAGLGIGVKIYPVLAWGMASSDLERENRAP